MKFALTLRLLPILLIFAVGTVEAVELKSGVFDPPRPAPDFSLHGSHGEEFTLSEHRDKLIILGFGFSHCPDICPMTLAKLAQAYKDLGGLANDVQVVYVTVDPERDTVERLHNYMAHFNPNFIGLTGTEEQLASVRKAYGIIAAKEIHGDGSYEVHHSSYLYLIDRKGFLRALVPFGKTAQDLVHDIKVLLRDSSVKAAQ